MKILVLSDSHYNTYNMENVISSLYDEIDMVLFLGDCCEDIIKMEELYPDIEYHYVVGNCDMRILNPTELLIEVEGKRIFLTHGHYYGVKYNSGEIKFIAEENNVDICLHGHTHNPYKKIDNNILYFNPGSIAYPRGYPYPSYGIIDIVDGEIKGEIIDIKEEKERKRWFF